MGQSWASFPATQSNTSSCTVAPCYRYETYANNGLLLASFATLQEAQSSYIAYWNAGASVGSVTWSSSLSGSNLIYSAVSSIYGLRDAAVIAKPTQPALPIYSCPSNATLSGSTCTCSVGFTQSGSGCLDANIAKCDDKKGGYDLFNGSKMNMPGASYCPASGGGSGCAAVVNGAYAIVDKTTGQKVWTTEIKYTGGTCTPPSGSGSGGTSSTGSGSNDAPTPCKGQQGIVNGVTVCIPFGPGNPPSDTVTSSTTNSGSGGTTTTTDHTTCDGTRCTTTTTTTTTKPDTSGGTGGTGSGTGTTTTTDTTTQDKPQDSFCKENPESPMCKSGSFGGDCGGGFSCDGDAIQCAIAQEQHRRNCQLFNPDTDPNSAVNKAMSGNDPGNVDAMKASAAGAPVGVGSFDFSGKGWARSCPQDPIIPIPWGKAQEFTLPFSKLCGPLGLAADIAVAITALACMVFVVRVPQA